MNSPFLFDMSVKTIIIKLNDNMDRLFGTELSNLLEPHLYCKPRQIGRVHSQSTRGVSKDPAKMLIKRFNRSSCNNNSLKSDKLGLSINTSQTTVINPKPEPKDVQLVEEYFEDCFKFMMRQEADNYKLNNYMGNIENVNERMRGILLDWLIDLHLKFKMFPQTLYAMTMIIDNYLSKKGGNKENLQLIGTAAFFIAAKYEETYQVPEIDDLVHFSAKSLTKDQIIKMEADIIEVLDFNLIFETSYKFLEPLSKLCKMEQKNFHLAQYVLEMSLLDPKFLEFKPSLMASSAIYLINKIRKRPESWPESLQSLTSYSEKDLKNCARELCHLLERAEDLSNNKSLKKKFSLPQYNEVTRIKLERKKQ